jgi:ribose transport system substrate-binding protein
MRKTPRTIAAVVTALSLTALAAACSSGTGSSSSAPATSAASPASAGATSAGATSSASTTSADTAALNKILAPVLSKPTSLAVTTPLSKAPPKGIKVVGLDDGLSLENNYYAGMAAASKVLGWQFSTETIDDSNVQSVISAAESAINGGAKAVVMVSEIQATINQILPLAKQHGAVILDAISGDSPHPSQILASTSSHESVQAGRYTMAAILQQADAAGVTANVGETFIPQFATANLPIENGMKAVMAADCPKCTLSRINISYNDLTNGSYINDIVSYLQAHPQVNYVATALGLFASGLTPALKQAGISVPMIVGSSPSTANFTDLQHGLKQEWLTVPGATLGWMWTDELARYFIGDNYNVWNTTAYEPQWLVTPGNVSQLGNVNSVVFPDNYQSLFEKLWNVS